MHIVIVSVCEKRALKKTRAVLDSYAIRTGQNTWQAPMTMEGLHEIRKALKKTATRQTAVAAYKNFGTRRMRLAWVVGSKHKFNSTGAYPVASTKKQQKQLQIPDWIKAASLLAGAAGDVHDIGKASQHFQHKLSPNMAGKKVKDDIRHEWLSMKLLQAMRANGWQWRPAWENIDRRIDKLTLGNITEIKKEALQNELEAVDYLVVTHHGLLGDRENFSSLHVRNNLPSESQITCAGDLNDSIFKSHRHRMNRLAKQTECAQNNSLYWKALSLHARAALIHADHIVSAEQFSEYVPENIQLFANTKFKKSLKGKLEKIQDQPLDWHLQQVGDRSSYIATKMLTDLNLAGLSEQTVEYICQPSTENRFLWQNHVANALQKQTNKNPDVPCLLLNIAGTGSGKTRMNLRAACTLRPNDPRIAIALNLRSLTLQTGEALQQSMNLSEDEIAIIIGDKTTQNLFNQRNAQDVGIDDDENLAEPIFDAYGEVQDLPAWLIPLYTQNNKRGKSIDKTGQTVLTSPLLVSTIDYLIAAGEPHRQGHHVKALLRLISSDLILDEIDGYEPKSLMAVLRLVQLAAMYGRHVICSSATLSSTVADSIYRAFESGIEMRQALYQSPQKFILAVADNELKPKIELIELEKKFQFIQNYQQHLSELQTVLAEKSAHPYRLAQLAPIENPTVNNWKATVLEHVEKLHQQHAWTIKKSDKKISFGLIRVANIKHAIDLAKELTNKLPNAQIACYHANDWLISRFHKEQRLDFLLSRHKKGTKRPTGNEHIYTDDEILSVLKHSQSTDDIPFIVIATPVEEVGRDHDFDWAIIDASSIQSIVQTAGRVNRHRLNVVKSPNIVIPQFNYRYCQNKDNHRKAAVFTRPGYEGYADTDEHYKTQDLAKLLPWSEENTLVIDARLRFDMNYCKFAKFDDEQIEEFNEEYFASSGSQKFSSVQAHPDLMKEQIYKDTCLRAYQKKEVYSFDYVDDELIFYHYPEHQKELNFATGRYEQQVKTVNFEVEEAPLNAWLNLNPEELIELCEEKGITVEEGCKISLAIYGDTIPQWTYHIGFGVYSKQ